MTPTDRGLDEVTDPAVAAVSPETRRGGVRRWRPGLRGWLIAAAAVVVLALLGWLVLFSPLIGARTVVVKGTVSLTAAQVRTAAGIARGAPLTRLDTGAVAHRVETLPAVARASVRVSFPSTVVVTVTERVAVGYAVDGASAVLVDATGVRFKTVPTPPGGLPRLTLAPQNPAAVSAVVSVAGALSAAVRAQVASIDPVNGTTVSDPGQVAVTLTMTDKRIVAWGFATDNALKARILPALLTQPGRQIDISNPELVVVR